MVPHKMTKGNNVSALMFLVFLLSFPYKPHGPHIKLSMKTHTIHSRVDGTHRPKGHRAEHSKGRSKQRARQIFKKTSHCSPCCEQLTLGQPERQGLISSLSKCLFLTAHLYKNQKLE